MKKIKLFGAVLAVAAIGANAVPASAVSVGSEDTTTTIEITNLDPTDPNYNKLSLLNVPAAIDFGTHEISTGVITATGTVSAEPIEVLDARVITAEEASSPLASRDWTINASYSQVDLEASNTLVSLSVGLGSATNGHATGAMATLVDGASAELLNVQSGHLGYYTFDQISAEMELNPLTAGTYDGTITFDLSDTL